MKIDPEQFFDHYTANGWKQSNGNSIRDWCAAVRTWERNAFGRKRQEQAAIEESNKHKPKELSGDQARFQLIKVPNVPEARDWTPDRCLTELRRRIRSPPANDTAEQRKQDLQRQVEASR